MSEVPPTVGQATEATGPGPSMRDIAQVFLLLGFVGFGGPVAHVALMRREIVQRRHWVTEEQFLDMFAACNLVPGPSSTELAIYLGYRRAGWRAMLLAGGLFILPAMGIMLTIAWLYTRFGSTPAARAILYGVRPVIVAIVLWALQDLARRALTRPILIAVALAVLGLDLLNVNPILLLFASCIVVALRDVGGRWAHRTPAVALPFGAGAVGGVFGAPHNLLVLFLTFLKIGAVSYGSGYVLLAFLHSDFVENLHWLTDRQLIDAVAIGQATPGPVFTTATFLGYLFDGVVGAVVATVAIFLPGFVFVPLLDRIVRSARRAGIRSVLEGANAAVLGLIAGVLVELGRVAEVDILTVMITVVAFGILLWKPLSSPALVAGGAVVGVFTVLLM